MEGSPDLHPTSSEDVGPEMDEALEERSTPAAPSDPEEPQPKPVEDQQTSLHDTNPSLNPPSSTDRPDSCLTDMDCPVCFSRYDIYRVPKELSCKHNFCAVCLKLLICNEGGTWRVICPICRAPTPVFGGLVRTLQNQESLMSRLENPTPKTEVPQPPGTTNVAVRLEERGQDDPIEDERHGHLKIAARRLVILLLILLILLIIIMQFLYTGIMKWVLGFTLAVVVIVTILLCFNPYCRISLPRMDNPRRDNDVSSV